MKRTSRQQAGLVVLVVLLGLCLHTYHTCERGIYTRRHHPIFGNDVECGGNRAAVSNTTSASSYVPIDTLSPNLPPSFWSGLFSVLALMLNVIERCVFGYFITFTISFNKFTAAGWYCLDSYIQLLGLLIVRLTSWPTNLIFPIVSIFWLLCAALILDVVLSHVSPLGAQRRTRKVQSRWWPLAYNPSYFSYNTAPVVLEGTRVFAKEKARGDCDKFPV